MARDQNVSSVTTRPIIPPYSAYTVIPTGIPNLTLRPLRASDLEDYHELRIQHDVMKYTSQVRIDANLGETRTWLGRFIQLEEEIETVIEEGGSREGAALAASRGIIDDVNNVPGFSDHDGSKINANVNDVTRNSHQDQRHGPEEVNLSVSTAATIPTKSEPGVRKRGFNFSLVYEDESSSLIDSETLHQIQDHDQPEDKSKSKGKVIGSIGCHTTTPEAEFGYMVRQEYWGRGFATAATKAYLQLWWSLEREVIPLPDPDPDPVPVLEPEPEPKSSTGGGEEQPAKTPATKNDGHNDDETTKSTTTPAHYKPETETETDKDEDKATTISNTIDPTKNSSLSTVTVPELLRAEIEESNGASARILEKLGFEYERDHIIQEGGKPVVLKVFYLRKQY